MITENNDILKQDLTEEANYSGVYTIWLLFEQKCDMPSTPTLLDNLKKRFGEVEVVSGDPKISLFALSSHTVTYKEGKIPSQLIITECAKVSKPHGDAIARTQFWDCPNGYELLDSCKYEVMIGDFMARGLPALERAAILADWLEIALEMFPSCAAIYVDASDKLLTAEHARNNPYNNQLRFIWFGVNARFFSIQGTNDSLVDTLGLYALGLPDVQYHFHTLNPDDVVNYAYNTAIYQFENDAPIKSGQTINGIPSGNWKCQYEQALIQPVREVLDVEAGEFASGNRAK